MKVSKRIVAVGAGVGVAVVVAGVVIYSSSTGSSRRSTTPGPGHPSSTTVAPKRHVGTLRADTASKYGQSPSAGTCVHWTQRFVNNSDGKVVDVTFAPASAVYSTGKPGAAGYHTWPATTPDAADLRVAIAPKGAQTLQFMTCTATRPPKGATNLTVARPSELRWEWEGGTVGHAQFA